MGFLTVLLLIAIVGGVFFMQSAARQQVTVHSKLDPAATSRVIQRSFRVVWAQGPGPGDYNYTTRLRAYPATMSIDCSPAPDGGSDVHIWVSEATTKFGLMGHAMLMWRKKRGLAAKLANAEADS